jgi:hypothetical protein
MKKMIQSFNDSIFCRKLTADSSFTTAYSSPETPAGSRQFYPRGALLQSEGRKCRFRVPPELVVKKGIVQSMLQQHGPEQSAFSHRALVASVTPLLPPEGMQASVRLGP